MLNGLEINFLIIMQIGNFVQGGVGVRIHDLPESSMILGVTQLK
jgi:hypothetical protein